MPASKPQNQPVRREDNKTSAFSIDEFIGEIEKAEADTLGKRLPQERLRNKRALDNAARRAAEKAGTTGELVPQPLQPVRREDNEAKPRKEKKQTRSAATGMSLKAPKSKANSVDRVSFDGMGEPEQAGFGLATLTPVSAASPAACDHGATIDVTPSG